jgi:type IV secretion system protein VirD4
MYTKFRVAAARTLKSILISVNARLGLYDTPELNMMMKEDDQKKNDIEIAPTI